MRSGLQKFINNYRDKKVLIMGLGLLGRGVQDAKFFSQIGARVTVTDLKNEEELAPSLEKLRGLPIKYTLGRHEKKDFLQTELILRNPAVPQNSPFLKIARAHHIPIEMEEALFSQYASVNLIGVSGTRGKSTTTVLIYQILKAAGFSVWLAGNIKGKATLPLLAKIKKGDWIVLELSSWQLQGFKKAKISPHIAILTNIYPDHLNRYKKMSSYIADKKLIFKYQDKNDFLILNKDFTVFKKLASTACSQIYWFSAKEVDQSIIKNIKLKGKHNLENVAAALKTAQIFKIKKEIIRKVISNFKGLKFRLERIATLAGVDYINDTTSTTPIAGIKALRSFKRPIILIAGGASKKLDMKKFAQEIVKRVRGVILLEGTATNKLKSLIIQSGGKNLIWGQFNKLKQACLLAKNKTKSGEIILFSPGCASFGMFKNEFDRGKQFNKIVRNFKIKK